MISPNKIIGSLVYRTREALRGNNSFLTALQGYRFYPDCFTDGKFNLWHYPGTHSEISNAFLNIPKTSWKFPSVLNFHPVRQKKGGQDSYIWFNLAIVGLTSSEWLTQTREEQVFELLLRPIYMEFMRQLETSGYFEIDYGVPPHDYYEVFTTGKNQGVLFDAYGDYIDGIELHNLYLKLRDCYTEVMLRGIEKENDLVTEIFN